MAYVHLVIALALIEFFLFGLAVARARARYNVPAPATSGNPAFERCFRVQMNTLEQLVIFVPSILLFGHYLGGYIAAALGLFFVIGRAVYFRGYTQAAEGRHSGFMLSVIPNIVLLVGGLFGAVRAIVMTSF